MRRAIAAFAALLVALAGVSATSATAMPLPRAASCSGVWVVVESTVRCATSHSTGVAALRSAGFSVQSDNGLICRIDDTPEKCEASFSGYWSYWHAKRNTDGSHSSWTYSDKGAGQYAPTQGDAEGWSFGDGSRPPSGRPPAAPAPPAAPLEAPTSGAAPAASDPPGGPSGPATAVFALGALAVGGVGTAWAVRRRRAP